MKQVPDILVKEGPLAGQRFTAIKSGLRLGRSSSCEISIPDPALSRNHCLFELRDGKLWVTDLVSANGTEVNGEALGSEPRALLEGDVIVAGDSVLNVVRATGTAMLAAELEEQARTGKIDLGLSRAVDEAPGEGGGEQAAKKQGGMGRLLLYGSTAGAILTMLAVAVHHETGGGGDEGEREPAALGGEEERLHTFSYEKVEASGEGIYRYSLEYGADGTLRVEVDDVPGKNRKVRKAERLGAAAAGRLEKVLANPALYNLEREYTGEAAKPNTLKSVALRVARAGKVWETTVENAELPDALREATEGLETFSKNELGIWSIQYPAEQLVKMSADARATADSRWEERDVQHGNLAAALKGYRQAISYLETVNPKPEWYGELIGRRDEAKKELDRRYRDQRFRADQAINTGDWETARRELRVLCEMLSDRSDARHAEASAKLVDVEGRLSKGGNR